MFTCVYVVKKTTAMDDNSTRSTLHMDYNRSNTDGEPEILSIPHYEKLIESFILTLTCIAAFTGNTSLWVIILKDKSLQTTSNALLLSLSAADWLVSVVNMPIVVYTIMQGDWMFSTAACVGFGFMTMLTFVASVMSLGTISFNRYIHICHPQKLKTLYTAKRTALWITGTWTLSATLASPPLFGWGRYGYLPGQSVCFADWPTSISYTFFMVGMCFGGPCTVMTFCYVNILRTVQKSKRKVGASSPISSAMNSPEVKSSTQPFSSCDIGNMDNTLTGDFSAQRSNNSDLNCVNRSKEETEPQKEQVTKSRDENPKNKLMLQGTTETESSPDNESENDSNAVLKKQQDTKGSVEKRIKKCISQDSTVRKSYRAGIINSMGSNSSLDKDVQKQIAVDGTQDDSKDEPDITQQAKRKLSFGAKINKRRLSAGKKMFGKFLSVPGRKPLQAEDLAERRRQEKEKRRKAEELRLTTSLFVVILVFVLCWLPFCCTMFWSVFTKDPHAVPRPLDMATLLLGCANSMCNPVIYGVMNKRFRNGFRKLFCFFRNHKFLRKGTHDEGVVQMNSTFSRSS